MKKLFCLVMMIGSLMQAHQPKSGPTHHKSSSMGAVSPRRAAQAMSGGSILVAAKKPVVPKLGELAKHPSLAHVIGKDSLESYDTTGLPNKSLRKETVESNGELNSLGLSTMQPPAGYVNDGASARQRRGTIGGANMRGSTPRIAFNPSKTVGSQPSVPSCRNPSKSVGCVSDRSRSSMSANDSIKPLAAVVVAAASANPAGNTPPSNRQLYVDTKGSKRNLLGEGPSIVPTRPLPTTDEASTPRTPNSLTGVNVSVPPCAPPRSSSGSSNTDSSKAGSSPSTDGSASGLPTGRDTPNSTAANLVPPSTPSHNESVGSQLSARSSVTVGGITVHVAATTHGDGGTSAQKTGNTGTGKNVAATGAAPKNGAAEDSSCLAMKEFWKNFKAKFNYYCCNCHCSCK